jgi:hypothetical protein
MQSFLSAPKLQQLLWFRHVLIRHLSQPENSPIKSYNRPIASSFAFPMQPPQWLQPFQTLWNTGLCIQLILGQISCSEILLLVYVQEYRMLVPEKITSLPCKFTSVFNSARRNSGAWSLPRIASRSCSISKWTFQRCCNWKTFLDQRTTGWPQQQKFATVTHPSAINCQTVPYCMLQYGRKYRNVKQGRPLQQTKLQLEVD